MFVWAVRALFMFVRCEKIKEQSASTRVAGATAAATKNRFKLVPYSYLH